MNKDLLFICLFSDGERRYDYVTPNGREFRSSNCERKLKAAVVV